MRNPQFDKLLRECEEIHDRKNTDYASEADPLQNLKACTRLGLDPIYGTVVRIQDKMARVENFFINGSLKNESLRDAFLDLAIYSLLAIVIMEEGDVYDSALGQNIPHTGGPISAHGKALAAGGIAEEGHVGDTRYSNPTINLTDIPTYGNYSTESKNPEGAKTNCEKEMDGCA